MHNSRSTARRRGVHANRHGRGMRSPVSGPELPILYNRIAAFDRVAGGTVEYLRSLWPGELDRVRFDFVSIPVTPSPEPVTEPQLWRVDAANHRITFYRVPLQRSGKLHVEDAAHRRMFIEYAVYSAVAEYLGKEPWELLPPEAPGHHF
ncbi:metallopeptidase family protein [Klugiella xanthotipulae]|uniref:Metallopeptidase family protein n=1 Tax=Klugiella xanthotipulae TaxID=244735 RepID=A0A543HYG1_9MICO|nr:hypothetical protein [Klugiella xanthotipulae]TQM63382.1 hypothetical protein FB466_1644 [Klugiella xanthotipulae]